MCFMQIESVLQTKNRSEPAKHWFSVALLFTLKDRMNNLKLFTGFRPVEFVLILCSSPSQNIKIHCLPWCEQ